MTEVDIVIVGAGAAGIAAGRWLAAAGRPALVLEARDRVGGRAWTETETFGFPVDMGCAWLHSADRNPWTAYAREQGFTIDERLPVWGAYIGREKLPEQDREEWGAAFGRNEALLVESARRGIDVAIAEILPQDKYRARFDAVVSLLMGADSRRMSSLDYANYADSDINWSVPSGLGAVVAHAAGPLNVRLSMPVREIDSRGRWVRIVTDAGSIKARSVVVTLPTSALHTGSIRFAPELPDAFVAAFAGVPTGANSKVFFRMTPGALPFPDTVNFVRTQDTSRIASYQTWSAGQEVLLAYFGGDLAIELERRGELEAFARDELRQIFGSDFLGQIVQSLSTNWISDPWSLGSYSYALAGQAHRRQQMSEPLHDRIFFAGEACSVHHAGTIHGAWHSGISAAVKALAASVAH